MLHSNDSLIITGKLKAKCKSHADATLLF